MKTSVFASAATLAGVAAAQLRLPLARPTIPRSSLRHRDTTNIDLTLTENAWRYAVNLTVGTPPQELSLELTLDGQETWVPAREDCSSLCPLWGSYEPDDSSTYNDSDSGYFSVTYGDGSAVVGREFSDTIRVGDAVAEGLTMGLATDSFYRRGELTIGPATEVGKSLVEKLVEDGVTNSAAFSFWLNSKDRDAGNLLFGAVDTSAFEGTLQRISTRPYESIYAGFPVDFSILEYTKSPGGDPKVIAPQNDLPLILLQPTNILSYFPRSIAEEIWDLAGATYDSVWELATIPCSGGSAPDSELILGLGVDGKATARVSFKDLITPHVTETVGDDDALCVFSIQTWEDRDTGPWALGGFVLQNTYIVFDLVNDEVALAPVRSASSEGEVVLFSHYGAEIPHSEFADAISPSTDYPDVAGDGAPGPSIVFLALMAVALVVVLAAFFTLMWCCWYRGWCCCKGRRKKKEPPVLPPPQGEPVSEKAIYAGAPPPVLPSMAERANMAGPQSGQLPLGCAWIIPPTPYAMPAGAVHPAPTEAQNGTSGAQGDSSTAGPGPVSPPASPTAGPSTRSPSPAVPGPSGETRH